MQSWLSADERKQVALGVLREFDRFCTEREIPYFLGAGTLLGAVRHQGFIPWDDDIDVYLLRPDHDRFIREYQAWEASQDSPAFKCLDWRSHADYGYAFARLVDARTAGDPRDNTVVKDLGVFVDVLVLDNAPRDTDVRAKHREQLSRLVLTTARLFAWRTPRLDEVRSARGLAKWLAALVLLRCPREAWFKKLEKLARCTDDTSPQVWDCVALPTGVEAINKSTYERSWCTDLMRMSFEGEQFLCPRNYHEMLSRLYGSNYMTPLKTHDALIGHDVQMYWKSGFQPQSTAADYPLISVVIPVYRVGKKCIDRAVSSVFGSTYPNLEVVLVDDGSTPDDAAACDDWVRYTRERNERIAAGELVMADGCERTWFAARSVQVVHQENGGLSAARNAGALAATGAYVAYLDSDDCVDPRMYEDLYQHLICHDAELACCKAGQRMPEIAHPSSWFLHSVAPTNADDRDRPLPEGLILEGHQALLHAITQGYVYAPAKLMTRRLALAVPFVEGVAYEDAFAISDLVMEAGRAVFDTRALYCYITREGSITMSGYNAQKSLDQERAWLSGRDSYVTDELCSVDQAMYNKLKTAYEFRVFHAHLADYHRALLASEGGVDQCEAHRALVVARERFTRELPAMRKNPYFSAQRKATLALATVSQWAFELIEKKMGS